MAEATKKMRARYEAAHAEIMKGDWKSLQEDIDSGAIWSMGDGALALAAKMLTVGAVMAPAEHAKDADGRKITRPGGDIPLVWILDGENGRGSIQAAEDYIANEAVLD
jgi:hypothetical protein